MPIERYVVIAKQNQKDKILKELEEIGSDCFRFLTELGGSILFTYIGRYDIQIDRSQTILLGINDEDDFIIKGDLNLALPFDAKIELVVGYSFRSADIKKIENNPKANLLFNGINKLGYGEISDEDSYLNCRFDLCSGERTNVLCRKLNKLADVCMELDIEYRIAIYNEDNYSEVLGSFEDRGVWIGPSAYVKALWGDHQLTLNSSDTFLDDNDIDYND